MAELCVHIGDSQRINQRYIHSPVPLMSNFGARGKCRGLCHGLLKTMTFSKTNQSTLQ
ncbi:hypothetical protein SERLA73DRAFT_188955 [Serpula lacrymans var. lacrymans S7.3]|uniref:Uncharacterized protein n=1 Tax=Serpula lacrymans var. lacrymans (strain S7.3) TaxID=936435 RepID=F8QCH6_SERL3|nr:hypothetical protein SERLA73DRAFT_188955 [Serpula lacrymans var. lacrymans S7.3]